MAELIRIGAYKAGSDAKVDEAIHYNAGLEAFLSQDKAEQSALSDSYQRLATLLNMPAGETADAAS